MLSWLKKYWPALILAVLLVALLDAVMSSLLTCHVIGANAAGSDGAERQQECTGLSGPVLLSLIAIIRFADEHGDAVTGIFTVVLAAFTGRLWISTEKLWSVTNQSVRLAQDEFFSSHRPRMRLKHIWLATPDGQRFFGDLQAEAPITARLDIVNNGDAVGRVRVINFVTLTIRHDERLPQRPVYNEPDVRQFRFGDGVEVGLGRTFTFAASDGRILSDSEIAQIIGGTRRLYFVGTIEYWWGENLRQTAFCRYLSGGSNRFEIDKDPDYEYED
jgi:hypothetical protein